MKTDEESNTAREEEDAEYRLQYGAATTLVGPGPLWTWLRASACGAGIISIGGTGEVRDQD